MVDETSRTHSSLEEEAQTDSAGLFSLLRFWFDKQKAITGAGSRLILAESRLAVLSIAQIAILGILAFVLVVISWILVCALIALAIISLGASAALSLFLVLTLHVLLIGVIVWVARLSLAGLRFETSRALFSKVKADMAAPED